jgi:DNA (cytosine-5)-methyltransferase 1
VLSGQPQNRARTILFAARRDVPLPAYPRPTHQTQRVPISMMTTWMRNNLLNVPSAAVAATLEPPLTLRDAFADLPSLAAPPARTFRDGRVNREDKETRAAPHRVVRYAGKTSSGAAVGPACAFQRAARAECQGDELHDHESYVLNEDDQERVEAVPCARVKEHACWRDIPEGRTTRETGKPLIPDYARSYRRANACFGRLAWSDIVPTVVCRPEPHNRPIIHPDEDRILSIRENARVQGFPDDYVFCGSIRARYQQVGNAVSPKLAEALGLQILRAFARAPPHGEETAADE